MPKRNRLYLDPRREYEDETMVKQFLNPYKDQALDYAFGVEPEQGSMYDLGRSLFDSNYDPKSYWLSRALKANRDDNSTIATNQGVTEDDIPMYGSDAKANIVAENDTEKPESDIARVKRKATTYNVADTRAADLPLYEVDQRRTQAMLQSEEEKRRMIAALRNRYV